MSRHTFAGKAGTTVAIGWDRPLQSFFVQVTRPHPDERNETDMLVWLGTIFGELPTAAAAIAVAAPYAELPETLGAMLETDRLKTVATPDGAAQIAARNWRFDRDPS
jgi:hypothetical protein